MDLSIVQDKVLSVIIPSYNMEAYLPRCLGSLIIENKELLRKLDIIVVNDGSKDRTREVAHDFQRRYPEVVRVIDKTNGNYGSCVNVGLDTAVGKYIKVLDADDYVDSALFAKYLGWLSSIDTDLALNDFDYVDAGGNIIKEKRLAFDSYGTLNLQQIAGASIELYMIAYRREVVSAARYRQTEGIPYTDTEWRILPMLEVCSVRYFPFAVVKYLWGREGQTMSPLKFASDFHLVEQVFIGLLSKLAEKNIQSL